MDIDLEGMQGDRFGVFSNIEADDDSPIERQLFEIGIQRHVIVARDDICGEKLSCRGMNTSPDVLSGACPAHVVSSV